MKKLWIGILLLAIGPFGLQPAASSLSSSPSLLNHARPLASLLPKAYNKAGIAFRVEKSQYRLTVLYQNKAVKAYPIVLGSDPVSDKLKEGDGATPEGRFRIQALYPHPAWRKFLWLDYPNQASWKKHLAAKAAGQLQAGDTIGSEIGLHGTPDDGLIEHRQNWTLGCVALKNSHIDELYAVARQGTPVTIMP